MPNKPNINKRLIALRIDLDIARKVEIRFGRPEDNAKSLAFVRALEEATRDVELTADDWQVIADEARKNELDRNQAK